MDYPELFGGLNCRIEIPSEAIEDLRGQLNIEEGSKSEYQAWPGLTAKFNVRASHSFVEIGEPTIKLSNAWDIL
jgi:hypothetical protein